MFRWMVGIVALLGFVGSAPAQQPAEKKPSERKIVSIAVLLTKPLKVSADDVRPRLSKRFGVPFGRTPDDANLVAQFRPNMIGVRLDGQRFGIITAEKPYSAKDAKWLEAADPRISEPFRKHEAWFAVDWFPEAGDADEAKAYQRIGQVVSELLTDDGVLLFAPATRDLCWVHEDTRKLLESETPLNAVKAPDPRITLIKDSDPRMIEATATAKTRWPEFAARFAARKPAEAFHVKKKFVDGEHTEFMWMTVEAIDGNTARGKLNNRPGKLKNIKLGDATAVTLEELNDWIIVDGDKLDGGFTVKVAKAVQEDADRKAREAAATQPAKPK